MKSVGYTVYAHEAVLKITRMLYYREDGRTMRPIIWVP